MPVSTLVNGAVGTIGSVSSTVGGYAQTAGNLAGTANGIVSGVVGNVTGQLTGIGSLVGDTLGSLSDIGQSSLAAVGAMLSGVGLGSHFAGTVGQVLSDGFSCWGSSMPPSETKGLISKYHAPFLTALNNAVNSATTLSGKQSAINQMISSVYIAQAHYTRLPSTGFDSCSRSGIILMRKVYDGARIEIDKLIDLLVSEGALKSVHTVTPVKLNIPKTMTGASADYLIGKSNPASFTVQVPQVNLTTVRGGATVTVGVSNDMPGSASGFVDGGSLDNVNVVQKKRPDDSSIFWIVALAAFFLLRK